MLFLSITLSWCVFSRDYCISGQLKSNISLGITKTVIISYQESLQSCKCGAKQKENCNFNLNKQKVPKCENSDGYKYTVSGY